MASSAEILSTVLFAVAVLHTFLSSQFQSMASRFREGSVGENFFHLIGEVEIVFGLWAGVLVSLLALFFGSERAVHYIDGLNFTEPLFVFAIMAVAGTRPVVDIARAVILAVGRILPLPREIAIFISCLVIGPLVGSLITEPAAMTVTALVLKDRYYDRQSMSPKFMYLTLAVLFVNVSIGGVLTHFAAPPVLMVASKWNWDLLFMFSTFGWKAALAVMVNASLAAFVLRSELGRLKEQKIKPSESPAWLVIAHLVFILLIVLNSHHAAIFMGLFLFFLGMIAVTKEYQEEIKLRESLLVAFFLGGLVVLGGMQSWWLAPLLQKLNPMSLFFGATALTAVTDNAALTYLGSQVPSVSPEFKYALMSGAVTGGGLTVIANAPNPAGFSILQKSFGSSGIHPLKLFAAALVPTAVAATVFLIFR